MKTRHALSLATAFVVLALLAPSVGRAAGNTSPRVIEILADHDSRFKIGGQPNPVLTIKAGERLLLRITAVRAKERARDGSVHGFVLVRKDGSRVPGWNFLLKPGTQEFAVTAPAEPGEYHVFCTVICSDQHEGMTMKVIVTP